MMSHLVAPAAGRRAHRSSPDIPSSSSVLRRRLATVHSRGRSSSLHGSSMATSLSTESMISVSSGRPMLDSRGLAALLLKFSPVHEEDHTEFREIKMPGLEADALGGTLSIPLHISTGLFDAGDESSYPASPTESDAGNMSDASVITDIGADSDADHMSRGAGITAVRLNIHSDSHSGSHSGSHSRHGHIIAAGQIGFTEHPHGTRTHVGDEHDDTEETRHAATSDHHANDSEEEMNRRSVLAKKFAQKFRDSLRNTPRHSAAGDDAKSPFGSDNSGRRHHKRDPKWHSFSFSPSEVKRLRASMNRDGSHFDRDTVGNDHDDSVNNGDVDEGGHASSGAHLSAKERLRIRFLDRERRRHASHGSTPSGVPSRSVTGSRVGSHVGSPDLHRRRVKSSASGGHCGDDDPDEVASHSKRHASGEFGDVEDGGNETRSTEPSGSDSTERAVPIPLFPAYIRAPPPEPFTEAELSVLRTACDISDRDKKGYLTLDELREAVLSSATIREMIGLPIYGDRTNASPEVSDGALAYLMSEVGKTPHTVLTFDRIVSLFSAVRPRLAYVVRQLIAETKYASHTVRAAPSVTVNASGSVTTQPPTALVRPPPESLSELLQMWDVDVNEATRKSVVLERGWREFQLRKALVDAQNKRRPKKYSVRTRMSHSHRHERHAHVRDHHTAKRSSRSHHHHVRGHHHNGYHSHEHEQGRHQHRHRYRHRHSHDHGHSRVHRRHTSGRVRPDDDARSQVTTLSCLSVESMNSIDSVDDISHHNYSTPRSLASGDTVCASSCGSLSYANQPSEYGESRISMASCTTCGSKTAAAHIRHARSTLVCRQCSGKPRVRLGVNATAADRRVDTGWVPQRQDVAMVGQVPMQTALPPASPLVVDVDPAVHLAAYYQRMLQMQVQVQQNQVGTCKRQSQPVCDKNNAKEAATVLVDRVEDGDVRTKQPGKSNGVPVKAFVQRADECLQQAQHLAQIVQHQMDRARSHPRHRSRDTGGNAGRSHRRRGRSKRIDRRRSRPVVVVDQPTVGHKIQSASQYARTETRNFLRDLENQIRVAWTEKGAPGDASRDANVDAVRPMSSFYPPGVQVLLSSCDSNEQDAGVAPVHRSVHDQTELDEMRTLFDRSHSVLHRSQRGRRRTTSTAKGKIRRCKLKKNRSRHLTTDKRVDSNCADDVAHNSRQFVAASSSSVPAHTPLRRSDTQAIVHKLVDLGDQDTELDHYLAHKLRERDQTFATLKGAHTPPRRKYAPSHEATIGTSGSHDDGVSRVTVLPSRGGGARVKIHGDHDVQSVRIDKTDHGGINISLARSPRGDVPQRESSLRLPSTASLADEVAQTTWRNSAHGSGSVSGSLRTRALIRQVDEAIDEMSHLSTVSERATHRETLKDDSSKARHLLDKFRSAVHDIDPQLWGRS